jgi:hypothetical protein
MRGARLRLGDPLDRGEKRRSEQPQRELRPSEISPHEGPAARMSGDPRKDVVAIVLSDGTVQGIAQSVIKSSGAGFRRGQIAGSGWTLWWELRFWDP